nr:glycosyltransferase [Deltaproteobacteria bacterium]
MKLSIIIPAYNEADRISETIEKTLIYLRRQRFSSEIIVVSDGSIDNTKALISGSMPS